MLQQNRNVSYWLPILFWLPLVSILVVPITREAAASSQETSSLQISASRIQLEAASRRVVYTGKVRFQHESLLVTGARAVAQNQTGKSGYVKISGNPVVAKMIDARGNSVRLTSNTLEYRSASRALVATGNVELISDQGVINGQRIEYDTANDRFSIEGNENSPRVSTVLNVNQSSTK